MNDPEVHIQLMQMYEKQYRRGLITYEEYLLSLLGQVITLEAEIELEIKNYNL